MSKRYAQVQYWPVYVPCVPSSWLRPIAKNSVMSDLVSIFFTKPWINHSTHQPSNKNIVGLVNRRFDDEHILVGSLHLNHYHLACTWGAAGAPVYANRKSRQMWIKLFSSLQKTFIISPVGHRLDDSKIGTSCTGIIISSWERISVSSFSASDWERLQSYGFRLGAFV